MNPYTLERLANGETIENYKESGNSMVPRIHSRQPITLAPVDGEKVNVNDIVVAKVKGRYYTHLVVATRTGEVCIGNNHGHINGWAKRHNIYAIVTHVDGREITSSREKVKTL